MVRSMRKSAAESPRVSLRLAAAVVHGEPADLTAEVGADGVSESCRRGHVAGAALRAFRQGGRARSGPSRAPRPPCASGRRGGVPRRQGVALADKGLQPLFEPEKRLAKVWLERGDRVSAEQALGSIVQQFPQRFPGRENLLTLSKLQDEQQRGAHATAKRRPIG